MKSYTSNLQCETVILLLCSLQASSGDVTAPPSVAVVPIMKQNTSLKGTAHAGISTSSETPPNRMVSTQNHFVCMLCYVTVNVVVGMFIWGVYQPHWIAL